MDATARTPKPAAWRAPWEAYAANVQRKLISGAQTYGDSAATRDLLELVREVQDELVDVAGWSCWLWSRLDRIKARLQAQRVELARAEREGGA